MTPPKVRFLIPKKVLRAQKSLLPKCLCGGGCLGCLIILRGEGLKVGGGGGGRQNALFKIST